MTINFFNILSTEGREAITAVIDGVAVVADDSHPNFDRIKNALLDGDNVTPEDFQPAREVAATFSALSERIAVTPGGTLLFDGDPVDNSIANAIVGAVQNGEEYAPLAYFMEKLAENPNRHSRQMAYDWLTAQGSFSITPEGDLLAYKGVIDNADGTFSSLSSGKAFVNGVETRGQIPQKIGDVVSMPRSEVQHDPAVGCHTGLHAGTWDYASSFGRGAVLKVKIHPRDIVSVPTDCDWAKMRVSKYQVVDTLDAPIGYLVDESLYDSEDEGWSEWDEDDALEEGNIW